MALTAVSTAAKSRATNKSAAAVSEIAVNVAVNAIRFITSSAGRLVVLAPVNVVDQLGHTANQQDRGAHCRESRRQVTCDGKLARGRIRDRCQRGDELHQGRMLSAG